MKKAYNESEVRNLAINRIAKRWTDQKLISEAQFEAVKATFPQHFYLPSVFIQIGLFIFTITACASFAGFISLFLSGKIEKSLAGISLICCVCFTGAMELLIKNRRLFHSGVDNALLYAAVITAFAPFFVWFENSLTVAQYCLIALVLLSMVVIRYADLTAVALWFVAILTLLTNVMIQYPYGKALLPFAIMALAISLYFLSGKTTGFYYHNCKLLTRILSLSSFYLAGNYYVVREGNAILGDLPVAVAPQLSNAFVFYALTCLVPLLYVFLGLKKKDRILLVTGLFSFGFSIFTYRYYFPILTIAQGLVVAGAAMITIAVWAIWYLKVPRYGLTDEADSERSTSDLEALLTSQYLGRAAPQNNGPKFGEGSFGGGGAGSDY
jgi:hypothetical protein